MFQTYRPSGQMGVLTIPLVIVALIASFLTAYVYQLLLFWIPLIYVNFLLTAAFGFLVGLFGTLAIKFGHTRNILMGVAIAAIVGLGGLTGKYYFQFQDDVTRSTDYILEEENLPEEKRAEIEQLLREEGFMAHIQFRVDEGWSIGRGGNGMPINGIFVYIIWLIEAGIVVGIAYLMTSTAAGEPYSETLNQWASEEETIMRLPITSDAMVGQIRNAKSVEELLSIPIPKTYESNQIAIYKVNSIEGQELEDAYLTVVLETQTTNKKGEVEKSEENLVQYAVLSSENRKQLVENAELLTEAIAEFQAASLQPAEQEDSNNPYNQIDDV